ncbi:hypothetical protein B5S30_g2759 [[Candida] boidinii]|nr:hypothetical protein B5S30_g2759 [[Candida] boidinii]
MSDPLDGSKYPTDLTSSLSNQPLVYLQPKQDITPLATPFEVTLKDPILQNYYARIDPDSISNELRQEILLDLQIPANDLKYLKFKKPALKLSSSPVHKANNDTSFNALIADNPKVPELIKDIVKYTESPKKTNLVKPGFKVKRLKLGNQLNDKIIDLFTENTRRQYLEMEEKEDQFDKSENLNGNKSTRSVSPLASNNITLKQENYEDISNSSFIIEADLHNKIVQELTDFIKSVGLSENEVDHSNESIWTSFEYESNIFGPFINSKSVDTILNSLTKIILRNQTDKLEVNILMRIEELAHSVILQTTDQSWDLVIFHSTKGNSQIIDLLYSSLECSEIILKIMALGKTDKRLYLEAYISSILQLINKSIEPISEEIKLSAKNELDKKCVSISHLIESLEKVFDSLIALVNSTPLDHSSISSLEWYSLTVIFQTYNQPFSSVKLRTNNDETYNNIKNSSNKSCILEYEKLRMSAGNLLISIFDNYTDVRDRIIEEIVNDFSNLSSSKLVSRRYRTKRGHNVSYVSILILRLFDRISLKNINVDSSLISILKKPSSAKEKAIAQQLIAGFENKVTEVDDECIKLANTFSSSLLNKIALNTDIKLKKTIEMIIDDFLLLLEYPEYPSCENVISSLIEAFLFVSTSDSVNLSSSVDGFVLEMMGSIGSKFASLRENVNQSKLAEAMNKSNYDDLLHNYNLTLKFLRQDISNATNYRFLSQKLLKEVIILKTFYIKQNQNIKNEDGEVKKSEMKENNDVIIKCLSTERDLILDFLNPNSFNDLSIQTKTENDSEIAENKSFDIQTYIVVMLSQGPLKLYEKFLRLVVSFLDHDKTRSRKGAIKNLSRLIQKEKFLLLVPIVKNSISIRLKDSFASVRDSMVELLSSNIGEDSNLADEFCAQLSELIGDPSVQVRRRVINSLQKIYDISSSSQTKSTVLKCLLSRMDDEDKSLCDLSMDSLIDILFTSIDVEDQFANHKDISKLAMERINVIIELVSDTKKNNLDQVERFLKEKIIYKGEKTQKLQSKLIKILKLYIESLLVFVTDNVHENIETDRIGKSMALLSTIVKCDFSLINQDQLVMLQPYLLDDDSTGDLLCISILKVFRNALRNNVSLKPSFINGCESSLLSRLTKFNVKELNEAIPCLWALALMSDNTIKVVKAAISTLNLLKPYLLQMKEARFKEDRKLHRLLFLIGNFGKYCDFSKFNDLFRSRVGMGENETVIHLIIRYILSFYKKKSSNGLKRVVVKNLINICSTHPKLFLSDQILLILDQLFGTNDASIHQAIIDGLTEFLKQEEEKSVDKNGLDVKYSNKVELDMDVFKGESSSYINDGICSSLVQRFMTPVLKLSLEKYSYDSYNLIKYLQLVINLGFANPKICIPTIISLEANPIKYIRYTALSIHKDIHKKYESLVEGSYIEGIKMAVKYHKLVMNSIIDDFKFLEKFLSVYEGGRDSSRRKFIKQLTKSLMFEAEDRTMDKLMEYEGYVVYICLCLSKITFKTLEESYMITSAIDKIISFQGANLGFKISEHKKLNSGDLKVWQQLCLLSKAFSLLISLRMQLTYGFQLDEDLISEYDSSKPNTALRGLVKNHPLIVLKIDELDLDYQEFNDIDSCKQICLKCYELLQIQGVTVEETGNESVDENENEEDEDEDVKEKAKNVDGSDDGDLDMMDDDELLEEIQELEGKKSL